jgi:hypothetical protein
MKATQTMFNFYLNNPQSRIRLDLDGAAMFFLVKFPSVLKPIAVFIEESEKAEQAQVAALAQNRGGGIPKARARRIPAERMEHIRSVIKNAAKLETQGQLPRTGDRYEQFIMMVMGHVIEDDPTFALRKNIYEASYANIVQFEKWKKPLGLPARELPGGAFAGMVIANDLYMGKAPGESCLEDPNCMRVFSSGKFTFSNSREWMYIYNAWNLAFMLSMDNMAEWIPKLVAPAVLEDEDGESYIVRRTIALWLTLFRGAFKNDVLKRTERNKYISMNGPSMPLSHTMGVPVGKMAADYRAKYWGDGKCPKCEVGLKAAMNGYARTFAEFIGRRF